ncbi:hypothetical protein [Nocardia sp. NPDC057353]|uniref:hypothetical protein n=1 Tax=Nocardia sp. NPDC057353 TaxID=3346104 RepID=UPI0036454624
MNRKMIARAAIGAAIVVAGAAPMAGTAAAQQPAPVRCEWGGDGALGQRYCDREGDTGSASGSGYGLGQVLGKLLFGGGR